MPCFGVTYPSVKCNSKLHFYILGGYRIHITDANIAKHIIVTNSKNYRRQDVLKKLLPGFGNGLITSNGRSHAIQRKHLNPFFSLAKVQEFFPAFVNKTNELIKVSFEILLECLSSPNNCFS